MDAYLEEELYDNLIYCLQNPDASDFEAKKQRVFTIGKELYADGSMDAMENMFYSIEFRIKEKLARKPNHIGRGGTVYRMNGNIRNKMMYYCNY